jgi:hypothetical protein
MAVLRQIKGEKCESSVTVSFHNLTAHNPSILAK